MTETPVSTSEVQRSTNVISLASEPPVLTAAEDGLSNWPQERTRQMLLLTLDCKTHFISSETIPTTTCAGPLNLPN